MEINKLKENDIIVVQGKAVQFLEREMDNGIVIQDIHTKKELTHINLVDRKATKDEVKWFCERTEKINFVPPKTN